MNRRNLFALLTAAPIAIATSMAPAGQKGVSHYRVFIPGDFGDDEFESELTKHAAPLRQKGYKLLDHAKAPGGWSFIFVHSLFA